MEYEEFLLMCLEEEITIRQNKKLLTLLKGAKLPVKKTLEGFDFKEMPSLFKTKILQPANNEYIRRRENTICVGKTHIAIALALAAINEGIRVRFTSVMQLTQELQLAQQE